jgi:hypothetical protein
VISFESGTRLQKTFGLKVGMVETARFEARIRELVKGLPDLARCWLNRYWLSGECCASRSLSCIAAC